MSSDRLNSNPQDPDHPELILATDAISPLDRLRIADPDTYVWVKGQLAPMRPVPSDEALTLLAETTIWGLSQEASMGEAVAKGVLRLMARTSTDRLYLYEKIVRQAAKTGPTLGRIMATFLSPVLLKEGDILERFLITVEIMQRKGTYTLIPPLEIMQSLILAGDQEGACAYLDMLGATFSQKMTYNRSLHLVYRIPKAVSGFDPKRRKAQILQLHKIAIFDLKLVEPFLDGVEKGTGLLDGTALEEFVSQALARYAYTPEAASNFLSLASRVGKDACTALGRVVTIGHVSAQLNRYLYARIGRAVSVKPLSELPNDKRDVPWVCSDGRHIYLPDEIDRESTQDENRILYKALSRLEAGYFECRTFDFDLEKAVDRYAEVACRAGGLLNDRRSEKASDGERFISCFSPRALGADLFNLFEQARVAAHLRRRYPGLMRQVTPVLGSGLRDGVPPAADDLLAPVYSELVLDDKIPVSEDTVIAALQHRLVEMFHGGIDETSSVETSARLACLAFDVIEQLLGKRVNRYRSMALPFGRQLHWDLSGRAFAALNQTAKRIKVRLKEMGVDLYISDLRNRLAEQHGALAADDIAELVFSRTHGAPSISSSDTGPSKLDLAKLDLAKLDLAKLDLDEPDLAALLQKSGAGVAACPQTNGQAFIYPEWDHHLQDYLYDHTRVYEAEVPCDTGGALYSGLLARHRGLVAGMRRAFELLKPEGLAMLRQWPEGDAFDYRALLDFAMDRRAGRIASDRLFIKRIKQEREVAVLLLVDLSRSTAYPVCGGKSTVLDVTQQALVLFCEALEVVGDDYAIAGFSGSGRHCVDFYSLKRFQEPLCPAVRSRISNLKPQRSTRMGAAIRHATALVAQAEARVRLMIVVSDGFPNDIGYKSDYAIADTCRSIQEARSRNFHVKAITVNIGSDPRLDDLYGRNHHHVIGDVRDLPDKLIRLYGALTRV
ncbi:MAG: hypothetical protein PVI54_07030 [Desulfobacteraceae bacterium]